MNLASPLRSVSRHLYVAFGKHHCGAFSCGSYFDTLHTTLDRFGSVSMLIQLGLEIWFEWIVFSDLEHMHWTAQVAGLEIVVAHLI